MSLTLISHQIDSTGRAISLTRDRLTIGRAPENDLAIDDTLVSREHACITREIGGFVLSDLRSKNGTWLNGARVSAPVKLRDGDLLRFGDHTFEARLEERPQETRSLPVAASRETTTVLFADLEGHTHLYEELGTDAAVSAVSRHIAVMLAAVERHSGRLIKTEGDGVIASFSSVRDSIDCAIAIQRELSSLEATPTLPARIGINTGDAIISESDLIGLPVVKASRVMSCARGGEIFISQVSFMLLGPTRTVRIIPKGSYELKGIGKRERVYEVLWRLHEPAGQ